MSVAFRRRWNEDDYYYDDDDDDDEGRLQRIAKVVGVAVVGVGLVAAGVLVVREGGDSTNAGGVTPSSPIATSVTESTAAPFDPIDPPRLDATARPTSDSVPADSNDEPTPTSTPANGTYALTPDGQPEPVTVTVTTDGIQMSGSVPSETARQQLTFLLTSISDGSVPITDELTVNPSVPIGVAVRLVPLDAPAYASGSFVIDPGHAAAIDRVVRLMDAAPNVTLLVVTHTDQIEAPPGVVLLSIARANAEMAYLAGAGIAANRLSSRSVGSTDLISTGTTPEALAANRRTDYIVSGLFVIP